MDGYRAIMQEMEIKGHIVPQRKFKWDTGRLIKRSFDTGLNAIVANKPIYFGADSTIQVSTISAIVCYSATEMSSYEQKDVLSSATLNQVSLTLKDAHNNTILDEAPLRLFNPAAMGNKVQATNFYGVDMSNSYIRFNNISGITTSNIILMEFKLEIPWRN